MHFAVWIDVFSEIERHCVVVCIKCQLCECMHMSHELLCFSIELLVSGTDWTNISFQSVRIGFLNFVEQSKESRRKFFILPVLGLSIDKVDSICHFYEEKKYKISIWFINLIVTMESHIFMVTICGFILFRILFPRIFPTPRHLYAWIAILLLLNVHLLIEKSSLTKNSNSRE